jgi:hypothetical protein
MLLGDLETKGLVNPPTFLVTNTHYLCRMGSHAYGVATSNSDQDIYGVVIPPRDYIFPPNYIEGFDNRDLTFNHWQQHAVIDKSANGGKGCNYDFSIYNIVSFFKLAMDNNPNVLDSLFVRRESIIHITEAFEIVRENRKIFLHKGVVHKMKGYAYSQLAKAKNAVGHLQDILNFEKEHNIPQSTTYKDATHNTTYNSQTEYSSYIKLWNDGMAKTTRFEAQKIAGFDLKFCYHIFRLVDQAEYILNNHDLDLMEPSRVAKMKAIRRGDLTFDEIVKYFSDAELRLANLYESSSLRKFPPTKEIRTLLVSTLESHYGSLSNFLKESDSQKLAINEIKGILRKYSL